MILSVGKNWNVNTSILFVFSIKFNYFSKLHESRIQIKISDIQEMKTIILIICCFILKQVLNYKFCYHNPDYRSSSSCVWCSYLRIKLAKREKKLNLTQKGEKIHLKKLNRRLRFVILKNLKTMGFHNCFYRLPE